MPTTDTPLGFDALNLSATALEAINRLGITTPTPIQSQAIPVALEGKDVFGIAQTGTGKTLAFALPILERLMPGDQAVVLAPTRELAEQIDDTFRSLGARTALLIGGANMQKQIAMLKRRPSIIVGTPGRAMDHIEQRTWKIRGITAIVLDEADRMFDIGFAPIIRRILGHMPKERQTMLFSATLSDAIEDLARNYMVEPARIEVAPQGSTAETVQQELVCIQHEQKHEVLKNLLYDHKGTVLVFARTRHGARKIAQFVRDHGHSAAEIHSDRTLGQRREALHGFKSGRYRVLVATDVAARGIDVKEISVVINFDIPEHAEDYVHRIGRTGRAGAEGLAITFTMPHQWKEVRDIEKLIQKQIPESQYSVETVKRPEFKPKSPRNHDGSRSNADRRAGRSGGRPVRNERPYQRNDDFRGKEGRREDAPREEFRREDSSRENNFQSTDSPRRDSYRQTGGRDNYQKNDYQRNDYRGDAPVRDSSGQDAPRRDEGRGDRSGNYRSGNQRPSNDRPFNDRPYNDRGRNERTGNDRPSNDRPVGRQDYNRQDTSRRFDSRNDRPQRSENANNRGYSQRPEGGRSESERPQERRSDYQQSSRPARPDSNGERTPKRTFSNSGGSAKPKRTGKPFGKKADAPAPKPERSGSKGKFSDQFGGMPRPQEDRKPKRRR
jgi:ATP-dependent RNA helicase RhlE